MQNDPLFALGFQMRVIKWLRQHDENIAKLHKSMEESKTDSKWTTPDEKSLPTQRHVIICYISVVALVAFGLWLVHWDPYESK